MVAVTSDDEAEPTKIRTAERSKRGIRKTRLALGENTAITADPMPNADSSVRLDVRVIRKPISAPRSCRMKNSAVPLKFSGTATSIVNALSIESTATREYTPAVDPLSAFKADVPANAGTTPLDQAVNQPPQHLSRPFPQLPLKPAAARFLVSVAK